MYVTEGKSNRCMHVTLEWLSSVINYHRCGTHQSLDCPCSNFRAGQTASASPWRGSPPRSAPPPRPRPPRIPRHRRLPSTPPPRSLCSPLPSPISSPASPERAGSSPNQATFEWASTELETSRPGPFVLSLFP